MIMGASLFDTVLDRVSREKSHGAEPASAPRMSLRSLGGLFTAPASRNPAFGRAGNDPDAGVQDYFNETYFAFLHDQEALAADPGPEPSAVEARATPERAPEALMFRRLSVDEIRADLNLAPSDTPAGIRAKRRAFARLNHPDRAPDQWRQAATARMKTANRLVDDALRAAALSRP